MGAGQLSIQEVHLHFNLEGLALAAVALTLQTRGRYIEGAMAAVAQHHHLAVALYLSAGRQTVLQLTGTMPQERTVGLGWRTHLSTTVGTLNSQGTLAQQEVLVGRAMARAALAVAALLSTRILGLGHLGTAGMLAEAVAQVGELGGLAFTSY